MPRLSQVQDQARRRVGRLAALGLGPEVLGARLVAAVEAAVGWDGYRLFGVDPGTLLVNRLLAASEGDGWARLEWLREVYLAAGPMDYLELPTLMRAGLGAVASHDRQEACWGYPPRLLARLTPAEHHRWFHELRSPVGGTLLVCLAAGGRWVAALQAYRRDPDRPFRAGDVAFVRGLVPTLGVALASAIERERALGGGRTVGPEASGILVVERDGRVRFGTPAGEAWAGLLGDVDRAAHGPLPTAVWSAAAGLRAGVGGGVASAVVVPTAAGAVRVEASPAGEGGATAVVLSAVRPPEPPAVPAGWPLTRGERAVVGHLLRGLGNREIAAALSVAEHTVEWHLGRVYGKLGVRGRTEVLARYFREAYLPGMGAGDDLVTGVDAEGGELRLVAD